MTEVEKAYIAGFVDGDGSIGLRKCHSERGYIDTLVRLRVTQASKEILDWIGLTTGAGTVRQWARCSNRHRSRFEWYCSGRKALAVIREIYPYLLVKKLQAEIVLKYEETMVGTGKLLSVEQKIERASLRKAMDDLMTHK